MGKPDDWFSCEGLTNRAAGVNKRESKERKWVMCLFWTICAVVWFILGVMHIVKFNNADAINSIFKDFKEKTYNNVKGYQENRISNISDLEIILSNALLYQADLAYDSCQIPYYKLDESITREVYMDTVSRYYDECFLEDECY